MSKSNCGTECNDVVTNTLALVPFSWDGVVWVGQALQSLWGLVTNAVN